MIASDQVRNLLGRHGPCQPQHDKEWCGCIPLPDGVARFYEEVGPVNITIEGYGNPTFLPCLSELWELQAGYRWNGITGEAIPDWDDDWLVVASEGGNPFIYSVSGGNVLFALHGAGVWEPGESYSDINTMAACMAILGSIVLDAGDNFTDDNCNVRPKFREQAISALDKLLGDGAEAEIIVDSVGWI